MSIPGFRGPYTLTSAVIRGVVPPRAAGVYVLGSLRPNGTLVVDFVGRSDEDLADALLRHVGSYSRFSFELAGSPTEAFQIHCLTFHRLRPGDNYSHPDRPADSSARCPICAPGK
jgi:hypothetical protein